ncbi:MAG: universal stress protein [Caldisphaera sp.]|uniref:universal stress protein n=1 Tax=Caldisphaera sp. TaxID=2060322 RepID=UPI003D0A65A6
MAQRKGLSILIPVDFSPDTEKWIKNAINIIQQNISKITFMYVLPLGMKELEDFTDEKSIKRAESIAKSKLVALSESFKINQYKIDIILATGDPASLIIDEANSGKYDLIAIGHRGYGYHEQFFIGSVTLKVLSASKIPVLVIRKERK